MNHPLTDRVTSDARPSSAPSSVPVAPPGSLSSCSEPGTSSPVPGRVGSSAARDGVQAPAGGAAVRLGKAELSRPPAGIHPEPRTWTIELPAGLEVLNLNKQLHWAKERAIAKELRKAAWALALQQKIPHLRRAQIIVEYQPPRTIRRRDAENIPAPSGKHAIDGLVAAKVLIDDECPRYVKHIQHQIGEPYPRGRLLLHVTEVAA